MGVILGSKAREHVWKSSADWLVDRLKGERHSYQTQECCR